MEAMSGMRVVLKSLAVVVLMATMATAANAQSLSDGDGAYKTGHYRDLFAERGHSAAESKATRGRRGMSR